MLSSDQREHVQSLVRPMQIIVFALFMGLMSFLVVMVVMRPQLQPAGQAAPQPFISYLAIIAAVVAPVVAWIVPRTIAGSMRQEMVEGKSTAHVGMPHVAEEMKPLHSLIATYQTTLIVSCAILEGAGFFNVVAYLLEHQQMNAIAAVVLAVLILIQFPTSGRLVSWVEDELNTIDRLRSMR
jgi:hypothetical protein